MIKGLNADHVDASGAYSQKFAVVQELLETGVLKEIPVEFREVTSESTQKEESVPVTSSSQIIGGQQEEFDMTDGHADHYDETGRYAKAYEAKFGPNSLTITDEQEQSGSSWKSFLQQIIAEEKSKLKV